MDTSDYEFEGLEATILSKEVLECRQLVTANVRLRYRMTDGESQPSTSWLAGLRLPMMKRNDFGK